MFLAGFGHVICLGLLYFLVRVKQAQSVVCNLWMVSWSRDRLACRFSISIVCIFSVRWGQSCLFMVFWGWLVLSLSGQCFCLVFCLVVFRSGILVLF